MPSSKPKAWWVVMMTMGLTIGAAMRKVSVAATEKPRIRRPRANGTLPHSHTGTIMPRRESTALRVHARRGIHRSSTPGGTHTCTTIDSTTPSTTNGRDSISTLRARVSPSCARVGSTMSASDGANMPIAKSRPMKPAPIASQTIVRTVRVGAATADGSVRVTPARSGRRARGAEAEDVDDVLGRREAVRGSRRACPLLDVGCLDLDGDAAGTADEVMVVAPRRARAVEALALGALQRIRVALGREAREGAVHGRESDARVVVAQRRVQALRAHEAARVGEGLADPLTLPRVALDHGRESTHEPWESPGRRACRRRRPRHPSPSSRPVRDETR